MRVKSYERIGEQVLTEQLPNGLTVMIFPKRGFSKYYAFFAARYGGADRRFRLGTQWIDTPEGVAHFLEHKMFDMPEGSALSEFSSRGASPNAFTSQDTTAYHFGCTERFDENLDTLLRFVSTPYFTDESVEKERGIIGQEIGMVQDDPDSELYYGLMKCLYRSHPIRESVAGTVESIAAITPQTLYDCHRTFYNPSNMVLCAAGDVVPERVISACLRILPKEAGPRPMRDYGPAETAAPNMRRLEKQMAVSRRMFAVGFKCPPLKPGKSFLRDTLTAELAARLLFGDSSPFYTELYGQGVITSQYDADFSTQAGEGFTMIAGESDEPDRVLEHAAAVLAQTARDGIGEDDFARVQHAAYGAMLRRLNAFNALCQDAADAYFDGYDELDRAAQLMLLTAEDVRQYVSTVRADDLALSVISPVSEEAVL